MNFLSTSDELFFFQLFFCRFFDFGLVSFFGLDFGDFGLQPWLFSFLQVLLFDFELQPQIFFCSFFFNLDFYLGFFFVASLRLRTSALDFFFFVGSFEILALDFFFIFSFLFIGLRLRLQNQDFFPSFYRFFSLTSEFGILFLQVFASSSLIS